MALVNRQNNLFASEDWKVAYKAYTQVNFQSYDYDTIRTALVNYIRENYPENFNDYIESSEFIAIIEMLAYLSQLLVFRMDLNSRENFLETAESRDSVFRLARMLGYSPSRNRAAQGLLKVNSITTTESVRDSLGNSLANQQIFWDDANNPDAYEQFITVMNSVMANTNRFSSPVKEGTVGGIATELYQFNTPANAPISYGFDINVNGTTRNFEIINVDFEDGGSFEERHPDPVNPFHILFRNDGLGRSSQDTGFFMYFKQGTLSSQDFNYTNPIESRIQLIDVANINESDIWVQETDTGGFVKHKWERVSNTIGQTLNFNETQLGTRNLYATETVNDNRVRIRYPDGNFGNIPYGIYRAWYRVSANEAYSIQPDDARRIAIRIPYLNQRGERHTLRLSMSLEYEVNNAQPAETLESIKLNAPQVYYAQNRMVSAQDYNTFPLSESSNLLKLKAINRTHAGHSRYIDITDPTGTYQDVEVYGEDGVLYKEPYNQSVAFRVTVNNPVSAVLRDILPSYLKRQELNNFVYDTVRSEWIKFSATKFEQRTNNVRWQTLPATVDTSPTGYFTETVTSGDGSESILVNTDARFTVFKENNFLRMVDPENTTNSKWTRITRVDNAGALVSGSSTQIGPFTLSEPVLPGWQVYDVIITLRKQFNLVEEEAITAEMNARRSFGLGYDVEADQWYVIRASNVDRNSDWNPQNARNQEQAGVDASWLMLFDYRAINANEYEYAVTIRGERYVVQSLDDIRFYNIRNTRGINEDLRAAQDTIEFTTLNTKPGTVERVVWEDSDDDGVGDVWFNLATGVTHAPNGLLTNIPLRSRDTKWYDVDVAWKSSFGLLRGANATVDLFVNEATVPLNTYYDDGNLATTNVTIANNVGQLTRIPSNITLSFTNNTFGYSIVDSSGNIAYKAYNPVDDTTDVFLGNAAPVSQSNANVTGPISIVDWNSSTGQGNLLITGLADNHYLYATDRERLAQDELQITYVTDTARLDRPVVWRINDTFTYSDGYTDASKAVVAPIDTNGDLVPDRPLQYSEYVDSTDIVIFERYTDFDGYVYDRPVSAAILDYRREDSITIVGNTISPGSYSDPVDIADVEWVLVKNESMLETYFNNTSGRFGGILVYTQDTGKVYRMTPSSTNINTVDGIETLEYDVRSGRGAQQNTLSDREERSIIRWQHVAEKEIRIDPSVSNVVEMLVLTRSYYTEIERYINVPGTPLPLPPTSDELHREFRGLNEFKNASDTLVFRSGKFRLLFGSDAESDLQARFRVVKLPGTTLGDNEIKVKVVEAIRNYFEIENWQFGETFYFTELSTYIHQQLGNAIGSIVIIPRKSGGAFGDLFQVKPEPNEIFLATTRPTDIEIVSKITNQTLRTDR